MWGWCSCAAAWASIWNRWRCFGIDRRREGEDLQGDPATERDLLGLVDDAHAAPPDLADDPVIAELGPRRDGLGLARRRPEPGGRRRLDELQHREAFPQRLGDLGVLGQELVARTRPTDPQRLQIHLQRGDEPRVVRAGRDRRGARPPVPGTRRDRSPPAEGMGAAQPAGSGRFSPSRGISTPEQPIAFIRAPPVCDATGPTPGARRS